MEGVLEHKINIDSWKLSTAGEKLYSADAVIDAYLKGQQDQLEQAQKVIAHQFERNVRKANTHTLKLIDFLQSENLSPISAYLRTKSFDTMEVLITMSEEDFLSEKITNVYDHASSIEQGVSDDLYNITFHFTYQGDDFNHALLKSDGYYWKMELNHPA